MKRHRLLPISVLATVLSSATVTAQTFTTIKSFGILTNITGFKPLCKLTPGPQGALYGTTSSGEGHIYGTIFKVDPESSRFTVLKWFTNGLEGASPLSSPAVSGHVLYGTTGSGGSRFAGTVFRLNLDGTGYTLLHNFDYTNGSGPRSVTLAGNVLYGTTSRGGISNAGTIFRLNTDGSEFEVLKDFTFRDGSFPTDGLVVSAGVIYGMTHDDGAAGVGTVFKLNTDGTGYTVLKAYPFSLEEGYYPDAGLILSRNVLYGTTTRGGTNGGGTVFSVNTDGSGYTILRHFSGLRDGDSLGRLELAGHTLYGVTDFGSNFVWGGTIFKLNTDGSDFAVLKDLGSTDSLSPNGVTLYHSQLYGTSYYGGSTGRGPDSAGTIFMMGIDGTDFTKIKDFTYGDGRLPYRAGVTASGKSLYGITTYGGTRDDGTIFRINPDGANYTLLKQFSRGTWDPATGQYTNSDGVNPVTSLVASDDEFYGTTYGGVSATIFRINADGSGYENIKQLGSWNISSPNQLSLSGTTLFGSTFYGGSKNLGIVYKLNTNGGDYTVLKEFTGPDGQYPYGGLLLSDNTLYGTTSSGGSSNAGVIFKLNSDGTGFTLLKEFQGVDGRFPQGTLATSDTTLYGTTGAGGMGYGTVFKINTDGSGFATIKLFAGTDGDNPEGVTLANGVLYGITFYGGSGDAGTVFQINTDGTGFKVLKKFTRVDGQYPSGRLILFGNSLYGTTNYGGAFDEGTIFKIDLSNPPIEPILQPQSAELPDSGQ